MSEVQPEVEQKHEAKIISGTEIAAKVTEELAVEVAKIKEATGTVPGLTSSCCETILLPCICALLIVHDCIAL